MTLIAPGEIGAEGEARAHRFAHRAMATSYEIVLIHVDGRYAAQCAHEAFRELDRLEQELSRYVDNSDIARINHAGAGRAVAIGADAFDCLAECSGLTRDTAGAFDVTVGPLLQYWTADGNASPGREPEALARARRCVGMEKVRLDAERHEVTLAVNGMSLDLGGYGKGYAVDRMTEMVKLWGIDSALLHGGASSVRALGAPPGQIGWRVTLRHPLRRDRVLARLDLRDRAVSGSGVGKGQHIIDPRSGRPVDGGRAAWSLCPVAAVGDALSTACMVMSPEQIRAYRRRRPVDSAVLVSRSAEGTERVETFGDIDLIEDAVGPDGSPGSPTTER